MSVNPEVGVEMTCKFGATNFYGGWGEKLIGNTLMTSDKQESYILKQGMQVLKIFVLQKRKNVGQDFKFDIFCFYIFII